MHCQPSVALFIFAHPPWTQFPHFVHNTELAMTLLPQTSHESILLLTSFPSNQLTINFVFLVLTFKLLLSSASFQFQNLFFKYFLVLLLSTRSFAYSNSLATLLAFSVITSTTIANNSGNRTDHSCTPTFTSNSSEHADPTLTLVFAPSYKLITARTITSD